MLKDYLPNPKETLIEQLPVVYYNLGDLSKSIHKAEVEKEPAYLIEAKIAIADLYAQLAVMCEKLGYDPEFVRLLGEERFIERMKTLREI